MNNKYGENGDNFDYFKLTRAFVAPVKRVLFGFS